MIKFDQTTDAALDPRVSTGVSGLDDSLAGYTISMPGEHLVTTGTPAYRGDGDPLLMERD